MLHLDRVTTTAKIQTKLLPTGMKCRRQTNGRIQGTLYITFQIERLNYMKCSSHITPPLYSQKSLASRACVQISLRFSTYTQTYM